MRRGRMSRPGVPVKGARAAGGRPRSRAASGVPGGEGAARNTHSHPTAGPTRPSRPRPPRSAQGRIFAGLQWAARTASPLLPDGPEVEPPHTPAPPAPKRRLRVLLVEDDEQMLLILARHLDRLGHAVRGAYSAEQGLALLQAEPADVVVSDVTMPGMGGRAFLRAIRERAPGTRVVLMTAFGSGDDGHQALREGACGYLAKPFKVEELAAVLRAVEGELVRG